MASKIKVGEAARSVDVSPNGELIAVGLKNGSFQLITFSTFKVCGKHRDRGSVISVVRYLCCSSETVYISLCLFSTFLKCIFKNALHIVVFS